MCGMGCRFGPKPSQEATYIRARNINDAIKSSKAENNVPQLQESTWSVQGGTCGSFKVVKERYRR
jgi:hypothetical protein